MIIKLSEIEIELPNEFDLTQRKKLVNIILNRYPADFQYQEKMFDTKYSQKIDTNKLAKIKLDILATYLIRHDAGYTKDVMSRYKEETRPLQERSFSQFDENLQDMMGWY